MNKGAIIRNAEEYAKEKMTRYDPGHDWWHVLRVRKNAADINSIEKTADPFILDISAILHDVADSKFNDSGNYDVIGNFLVDAGMLSEKDFIIEIIRNISFSNKSIAIRPVFPEFLILQDADRLDAIGAIGIARAFSYGSFIGNPIWCSSEENGTMDPSTIRHFYDKLLKLKDLMNTNTGRKLALERHEFMKKFLRQFYSEWKI